MIPVPVAQDCATVQSWLQTNAARLPTAYEDITRYPMAYRRAIFSTLSAEQKSALWQQHLGHYMDSHPHLSPKQVALVWRGINLVSTALFLEPVEAHHESLEALRKAAVDELGKDEARRLFATLGTEETEDFATLTTCECSTQSDWCPWWHECYFTGSCTQVDGCGTFYNYRCVGECLYRP